MILILGGTSDTKEYIEKHQPANFIISVATEYGFKLFSKLYGEKVFYIRFTEESLISFIDDHMIINIIDTTHPFAKEITSIAASVSHTLDIKYENYSRQINIDELPDYDKITVVSTFEEAAELVASEKFRAPLLTIGSKEAHKFCDVSHKSYLRILPFENSIKLALESGFSYDKIIAIQGPFSTDFNLATIKEKNIDVLVTKFSGDKGGFEEKIEACRSEKIDVVVIMPE